MGDSLKDGVDRQVVTSNWFTALAVRSLVPCGNVPGALDAKDTRAWRRRCTSCLVVKYQGAYYNYVPEMPDVEVPVALGARDDWWRRALRPIRQRCPMEKCPVPEMPRK